MSFCLKVFSLKKNMLTYSCGISNAPVEMFETSCRVNAWASVLCFDSPCSFPLEMPAVLCSTPCYADRPVLTAENYFTVHLSSSCILLIGTNK